MNTSTTTGTWRDQNLEPARRAELLLANMTTAEKCHRLTSRMPWSLVNPDGSDASGAEEVLRNAPGHVPLVFPFRHGTGGGVEPRAGRADGRPHPATDASDRVDARALAGAGRRP